MRLVWGTGMDNDPSRHPRQVPIVAPPDDHDDISVRGYLRQLRWIAPGLLICCLAVWESCGNARPASSGPARSPRPCVRWGGRRPWSEVNRGQRRRCRPQLAGPQAARLAAAARCSIWACRPLMVLSTQRTPYR
jgi:hypothetical protein